MLLLRLGSGHTAVSQHFADLPQFSVWAQVLTVEVAASAAAAVAMWPAFLLLCQATGRRPVLLAMVAWLAVGLLTRFAGSGPLTGPGYLPLWLLPERITVATAVTGVLLSPSVLGLMLVQSRLSALGQQVPAMLVDERADRIVVELLWLRAALQRFLISLAVVISGAVLAAGALRNAFLASGAPARNYPVAGILTYGGFFTMLTALIFVPAYVAWQQRVADLRDRLYPVPGDGLAPHTWYEARSDLETLLPARPGAASVLAAAFAILAPLAGSLVSALIPTP